MLRSDHTENAPVDGEILHPGSRTLFRYWETIRAERPAPHRVDLDLGQIRAIVPDLFVLERDHVRQTFRFRLAGTRINQLHHKELTRADVLHGWDRFERDTLHRLLTTTVSTFQPCVVRMRLHSNMNHVIGVEMLCLPIVSRDDARMQIVGGLFPFRDVASLGYDRIVQQELTGARTIWTEHAGGGLPVRPLAPAAKRPLPFTVIQGGRD
jgi:hypothetical protein